MKYRAVLFDFDYTLGDATQAIYTAFTHAFTQMGLPPADRERVRGTIGMMIPDAYALLTGDPSRENAEIFYSHFHPVARDLQAQGVVDFFPGALELLTALKGAGSPPGW